MVEGLVIVVA